MAVVEDNSLEFALKETAKGFSRSGKSIILNQNLNASSTEKMFWRFYRLVFGESAIFQLFARVKEYMSKNSACMLVICLLQSLMEEQIAETLPDASLGDVGAGKFQLLFSSVFSCAVCVSLEFSVIFLLSAKVYRLPKLQIFLAHGLQTRSEKFSSRSMEMPVFFKTSANTTSRKSVGRLE